VEVVLQPTVVEIGVRLLALLAFNLPHNVFLSHQVSVPKVCGRGSQGSLGDRRPPVLYPPVAPDRLSMTPYRIEGNLSPVLLVFLELAPFLFACRLTHLLPPTPPDRHPPIRGIRFDRLSHVSQKTTVGGPPRDAHPQEIRFCVSFFCPSLLTSTGTGHRFVDRFPLPPFFRRTASPAAVVLGRPMAAFPIRDLVSHGGTAF